MDIHRTILYFNRVKINAILILNHPIRFMSAFKYFLAKLCQIY